MKVDIIEVIEPELVVLRAIRNLWALSNTCSPGMTRLLLLGLLLLLFLLALIDLP